MSFDKVYRVVFSPTGTSRKVADAIAGAMGCAGSVAVDVTLGATAPVDICREAVAVFAVPVYGGHVPPVAKERLAAVSGNGTPAVVVVVYGNRDFEGAATELAEIVCGRGFNVVAAAAFIGEHSYSSEQYPIAAGRPDAADLDKAAAFGRDVAERLRSGLAVPVDVSALERPKQDAVAVTRFVDGAMKARMMSSKSPSVPVVPDASACVHCGECAAVCPVGAIEPGREEVTDAGKCIRCCACVKICPQQSRVFDTPFAPLLATNFKERKEPSVLL